VNPIAYQQTDGNMKQNAYQIQAKANPWSLISAIVVKSFICILDSPRLNNILYIVSMLLRPLLFYHRSYRNISNYYYISAALKQRKNKVTYFIGRMFRFWVMA